MIDDIFPFLMIIAIVWIISRRKIEEKRISASVETSAEKATQYTARMAEMEDRLRVLERIITDKGYDVATQIEALRDQRRVEERFDERLEDRSKVQ